MLLGPATWIQQEQHEPQPEEDSQPHEQGRAADEKCVQEKAAACQSSDDRQNQWYPEGRLR